MKKKYIDYKGFNSWFTVFVNMKKVNVRTKLGRCGIKLNESISPKVTEYNSELSDLYLDHALTDPKTGALLLDPKSEREYHFSKDEFREMRVKETALVEKWNETELDLKPHYATEVPEGLPEEMIEAFRGFIIDPDYVIPEKK